MAKTTVRLCNCTVPSHWVSKTQSTIGRRFSTLAYIFDEKGLLGSMAEYIRHMKVCILAVSPALGPSVMMKSDSCALWKRLLVSLGPMGSGWNFTASMYSLLKRFSSSTAPMSAAYHS